MKKILIIEDEDAIAMALESYILSLGYEVTNCVTNAKDAKKSARLQKPDLIISDIMIKGDKNGAKTSKELYDLYKIPIIFITAHVNNKILDEISGANVCGYMTKPYKQSELKAMLRLTLDCQDTKKKTYIKFGDYEFDMEEKVILKDMETIDIGKKASLLISILLTDPNRTISYDVLMDKLNKNEDDFNMDNLRHMVQRIKNRLNIDCIVSVRNEGYMWVNKIIKNSK